MFVFGRLSFASCCNCVSSKSFAISVLSPKFAASRSFCKFVLDSLTAMRRSFVLYVSLGVAACVSAAGAGAAQAGEPLALNVEYDVPVYGATDAAVRVQRGVDLEAKVRAKSSFRAVAGSDRSRHSPFSALAMRAAEPDVGSNDAEVTVHVPSPTAGANTALADFKADAAILLQLARAQDLQEQRFVGQLQTVENELKHGGIA